MPPDDQLPLPGASSLPHPMTAYFCRVGRAINGQGYIGYHSIILPISDRFHSHAFTRFVGWYNRASKRWEALPKGYTTNAPPASYSVEQAEEWWEESEEIIQLNIDLDEIERREAEDAKLLEAGNAESSQPRRPSNTQGRVEEGSPTQVRQNIQDSPQRDTVDQADMVSTSENERLRRGYVTESTLTASDYSESKKADLRRRDQARKNRGLGHDEMNTEEEEADDEMVMQEEDKQERLRPGRRASRKASLDSDDPREKKRRGQRRLVKGKRPTKILSADSDGSGGLGDEFARTLRRLAKSKPPAQKPSIDSEGSDGEDASPTTAPQPVASVRALGKKRSDPVPNSKRGPFNGREVEQAMELADTIVAYCKNMGRTPESVLRKGGFNVSLSRQPSWWDIWQMYLRLQSYNPQPSTCATFHSSN